MGAFLATLSAAGAGNWAICKRHELWGTGSSATARKAARQVVAGDPIYVWQSGEGLIAKAVATTPARTVTSVASIPWPEPERYTYTVGLNVVSELATPIADRFKEHRSVRFGLRTHELQAGFIRLDEATAARLDAAIAGDPVDSPAPEEATESPAAHTPEFVSDDRRAARPLAGVYLRPSTSVTEALLALYRRVADDEDGELLVVGDERSRASVERELRQEPFNELAGRVRFVTGTEMAREIERRFPT